VFSNLRLIFMVPTVLFRVSKSIGFYRGIQNTALQVSNSARATLCHVRFDGV